MISLQRLLNLKYIEEKHYKRQNVKKLVEVCLKRNFCLKVAPPDPLTHHPLSAKLVSRAHPLPQDSKL